MTTPFDESPDPTLAGPPRPSYRLTWILTAAGIFVLLLACTALILIASFRG
jgi:hypothetical protein